MTKTKITYTKLDGTTATHIIDGYADGFFVKNAIEKAETKHPAHKFNWQTDELEDGTGSPNLPASFGEDEDDMSERNAFERVN